ncbi:MAG: O-antigen ligase family protein [Bdellovibrionales bacterium]
MVSTFVNGGAGSELSTDVIAGRFSLSFYILAATFNLIGIKPIASKLHYFWIHLLWISTFGIVQGFTGIYLHSWNWITIAPGGFYRVKGFFSNTMTYSYTFAILLCFLLGFFIYAKKDWKKYLMGATILSILGSLVLTYTRGMWGAVLMTLLIMLALVDYSRKLKIKLLAGSSLCLILVFLVSPTLKQRLSTVFDSQFSSNSMRLEIWSAHWAIAKDNFLIGVGSDNKKQMLLNYLAETKTKYTFAGHAHNNYLEVLTSSGIIGLLIYLVGFGGVFYLTVKSYNRAKEFLEKSVLLGSIGAQSVFHLGGLTECTFLDYEVLYAMTFVMAISAVVVKNQSRTTT